MTLTIDLTPEQEARLQREAARYGLAPAIYAHRLLVESLPPADNPAEGPEPLTDDEFDALLDAMSEGMDPNQPPLAEEATRRASFYGDRG